MYLEKNYDDCLKQLGKYRNKAGWEDFFEKADDLKTLDEEYNGAMHDPPVPKKLGNKIVNRIRELEDLKQTVERLVKGPNEGKDYDAVENLIFSAKEGFNFLLKDENN